LAIYWRRLSHLWCIGNCWQQRSADLEKETLPLLVHWQLMTLVEWLFIEGNFLLVHWHLMTPEDWLFIGGNSSAAVALATDGTIGLAMHRRKISPLVHWQLMTLAVWLFIGRNSSTAGALATDDIRGPLLMHWQLMTLEFWLFIGENSLSGDS